MTKTINLIAVGIAALLLATGTTHATENFEFRCGHINVNVFGHHGYSYSDMSTDRIKWKWNGKAARLNGKRCKREE
jgi:hypothetical protein